MKVAVPYENGNVFGHFGHAEKFMIYSIDDGKVVGTELVAVEGEGHCTGISALLASHGVNVLICGGIGGGAVEHMKAIGVTVYGGITGSADEAVAKFISGSLERHSEANCSHEHEHGESHNCRHD